MTETPSLEDVPNAIDTDVSTKPVLVLDAMGVIYKCAEDIAQMLAPFVTNNGGAINEQVIAQLYIGASLGRVPPDEFWDLVGLKPEYEAHYLARHELSEGLKPFLEAAKDSFSDIICLSNDIPRWALKLRQSFAIEDMISKWLISGDLGMRTPDAEIFHYAIKEAGVSPDRMIYVGAKEANLNTAAACGMRTVLFLPGGGADMFRKADEAVFHHTVARSFDELLQLQKSSAILVHPKIKTDAQGKPGIQDRQ